MPKLTVEQHTHLPEGSVNLLAIVFGIIFMIVGWYVSPLGFGFQALIFLIGLALLIFGFLKFLQG